MCKGRPLHSVHGMHEDQSRLLTARQVQGLFCVDRSTVYRMAAHGQLPAVKIGRQWRFPADEIEQLARHDDVVSQRDTFEAAHADGVLSAVADAVAAVSAELLGVTIVVTDMHGRPITGVANPCLRLLAAGAGSAVVSECLAEWKQLAEEVDLEPRFRRGAMGFDCARAFVRSGTELVAMVVAGGIATTGESSDDLHRLDETQRQVVLAALPRIAATLSRAATGRRSADFSLVPTPPMDQMTAAHTRASARQPVEV